VEQLLPVIVRHYGEPFADPSAIPSSSSARPRAENVTVVLNGDGGDELLGGYPRYRLSNTTLFASRLLERLFRPDYSCCGGEFSGGADFFDRASAA